MKLNRFEVTITQKRSRYIAKTPMFPKCQGIGETTESALKLLSGSIGRHLAKSMTEGLSKVLISEDYTQVLSPVKLPKDGQKERRVYSIEQDLPYVAQEPSMANRFPMNPSYDDLLENSVRDLIQSEIDVALEEGPVPFLGRNGRRQDDDGAFGILMSLN